MAKNLKRNQLLQDEPSPEGALERPDSRSLLLIETMTVSWLIVSKIFWRSSEVCVSEETRLARWLSRYFGREYSRSVYADIPGSYITAHKNLLALNEELFSSLLASSKQVRHLSRVLGEPAAQALLLKSLTFRTFERTMKALIIFSRLATDSGSAVFLPRDAQLVAVIGNLQAGRTITEQLRIPTPIKLLGYFKSFFGIIAFNLYYSLFVLLNVIKRGVRFRAKPVFHPVAIRTHLREFTADCDKQFLGLDVKSLNTEFENKLLVLFEYGLTKETKADLNELGISHIDLSKEKVPFRVLISAFATTGHLWLGTLLFRWTRYPYLVHRAYVGTLRDLFHAKTQIDRLFIKSLVNQHDYTIDAIINTVITNDRGGKTFSYQHGNFFMHHFSSWYTHYDFYAVWGEYYTRLHKTGWRFIKNVVTTGACFQTKALTYLGKTDKAHFLPDRYKDLFLVVAYPTSYTEDLHSNPAHLSSFYRVLIDLVENDPDIYVVIKTKNASSDKNNSELIAAIADLDRIDFETERDSYFLLDLADLVIAHQGTAIGLEGLTFGKKVLCYTQGFDFFLFDKYNDLLVPTDRKQLLSSVQQIKNGEWLSPEDLQRFIHEFNDWPRGGWQEFIKQIKTTAELSGSADRSSTGFKATPAGQSHLRSDPDF